MSFRFRILPALLALGLAAPALGAAAPVRIVIDPSASPRVAYGAGRLAAALRAAGVPAEVDRAEAAPAGPGRLVLVGTERQAALRALIASGAVVLPRGGLRPEGFAIDSRPGGETVITGDDDSGALYGCLELADRVEASGRLPAGIDFHDAPVFTLRGPCIGMQKPYLLPGLPEYDYPYTPRLFPFFYDKAYWIRYLDFLADNRMNTLTLWNGCPFASLVKAPGYGYAVDVSPATFARNVAMMRFITREADRRGIWVIQMFYNILLPKPLAERYHLPMALSAPNPVAADYTRKAIAAFIRQYPHVGLMVCLGEALRGTQNQIDWCTKVILPGVRDGMREAGLTEEPPVIIRTHATDATKVMPAAFKVYRNLITMTKLDGESLTTCRLRGDWRQLHVDMARLGGIHMINVHVLANLEPFRYGATRFIQRCMQDAHDRLGATALHLYPLEYWDWPYSPDRTEPRLLEYRRDWIWYAAWARYAWNPDRNPAAEQAYWTGRLARCYGTTSAAAGLILAAYNDSGKCAPLLLRRFGITDGNRQTLSLGMTLDQLVDPGKYHPFPLLWESEAPPGERLQEYADREWNHQAHSGETPPEVIREVLADSARAVDEIRRAAPAVTRNRAEFGRLENDLACIQAMSRSISAKAEAALDVLRYRHSRDPADLVKAQGRLAASLDDYRTLVALTRHTYLYANGLQTSQRRIPVKGGLHGHPANYRWDQLLPLYEKELADFRARVARAGAAAASPASPR
jgi:hypothetical protein